MMGGLGICIPVTPPAQGGGGFRFLRNFASYLDRHGIRRSSRPSDGLPVLFLNAWHSPWRVVVRAALAFPGLTVVHRVDGSAEDYGRHPGPDKVQSRVNRLADLTIFQSQYCRHSTRVKFPVISHDGPVIHNPVDTDVFRPDGERYPIPPFDGPRVCAVTWSTNPRKGAASLYRLAATLRDVQFVLCGRFDEAPILPNVVPLGVMDSARLAAALRSCDVLATFAENEACPNVALEALASGLPVLYRDSGAAAEIVGDCGTAVTVETFRASLAEIMERRGDLSVKARRRAVELFAPEDVFARYVHEIEIARRRGAISRPARLWDIARRLASTR